MTTSNGGKGIAGGLISLCVIGGLIYLRVTRSMDRSERRHQQDAQFEADHRLWKSHALDMMKSSPDKGVVEYLTWGVESFHDEADEEAMDSLVPDGAAYRDILITKIYDSAKEKGREDVTRSLDKMRTQAQLADPSTWWMLGKKK